MSSIVHQWLWPALVAALSVWSWSYARYLAREGRSQETQWSRYFSNGQAQAFQSFLFLGTLLPALATLAGSGPTIVNAGGNVIAYHVTTPSYVSRYIETNGANHLLLLARVNRDDAESATATVVLYGVNDSGDEGEIGRFSTGANYWTRYERPLTTRRIRLIVDYAGKGTKAPNVDLTLYLPPGPPAPAAPPATTTSAAAPK